MKSLLRDFLLYVPLLLVVYAARGQAGPGSATNLPAGVIPSPVIPGAPFTNVPTGPLSWTNWVEPNQVFVDAAVKREIRPLPGGAVADYGRSRITFPYDIAVSPLEVTAPDGRHLAFRPACLAMADRRSPDNNYLLARATNCIGEIISPTEVLYSGAFDQLQADILYRYAAGLNSPDSLEQFIILHENPELPKDVDPKEVSLELWTEWFDSEPVAVRVKTIVLRKAGPEAAEVEVPDCDTDFGTLKVVAGGKAFSIESEEDTLPVAKAWAQAEAGSPNSGAKPEWFVIESVDYTAAKPKLDKLAKATGHASIAKPVPRRVLLARLSHGNNLRQASTAPLRTSITGLQAALAPRGSASSGFVIDFNLAGCTPVPSGLVCWWPGDGTSDDLGRGHPLTLAGGATYQNAVVLQGFYLSGSGAHGVVSSTSDLNVGVGGGFTVEAWVERLDSNPRPICEWDSGSVCGAHFWVNYPSSGGLYANIADTSGYPHMIAAANVLSNGMAAHVAVTYDKATGTAGLYVNGSRVAQSNLGSFTPESSHDFYLGYRADGLS